MGWINLISREDLTLHCLIYLINGRLLIIRIADMRIFLLNFFWEQDMKKFKSVDELISQLQPDKPVYCIRKKSIQIASKYFQNKFPGSILYAENKSK